MKSFSLLLVFVLLFAGYSDPLSDLGVDYDAKAIGGQESLSAAIVRVADLSLAIQADTTTPSSGDSLFFTVELHNEGPDAAMGVEVVFQAEMPCVAASSGGTGGYGILMLDVSGPPPGASEVLEVACFVSGPDPFTSKVEVMTSKALDPDSVPGNGNPNEDDYASVTIYPEP